MRWGVRAGRRGRGALGGGGCGCCQARSVTAAQRFSGQAGGRGGWVWGREKKLQVGGDRGAPMRSGRRPRKRGVVTVRGSTASGVSSKQGSKGGAKGGEGERGEGNGGRGDVWRGVVGNAERRQGKMVRHRAENAATINACMNTVGGGLMRGSLLMTMKKVLQGSFLCYQSHVQVACKLWLSALHEGIYSTRPLPAGRACSRLRWLGG